MKKILFTISIQLSFMVAQSYPFKSGELLIYEVNLNLISAGKATLKIKDNRELNGSNNYHIIFNMATNKIWDAIFPIRDTVDSWIDTENLFTQKLRKVIREPRYSQNLVADFDYYSGTINTNKNSLPVTKGAHDPYSFFYYLRTLPLRVGELFELTIFDNYKLNDLNMIVHRKENISVIAGKFDCFVVEPFKEGRTLFKNKGDMKVWISDDEHRLPVMIVSKAAFGSLVMKLSEYSLN